MSAIRLRSGDPHDIDAVLALWAGAGAPATPTDDAGALGVLIGHDPGALVLAVEDEAIAGTVIAAWNGWRGSLYRLAVEPSRRRRGVATELVREAERRLLERGARRVDALVATDDAAASAFWRAVGYELQDARRRFVRNF